jgi:DNA-binding HxlR family transcriptional regulator
VTRRQYQQCCPLAHALDLVGERWTLLIVRELQLGPRRFSDIERGLPGINPNLLSERLHRLEGLDIVARDPLPPPVKGHAYALTETGQALNEAMAPLAAWGMQYLEMPFPEEEYLGAVPAMASLRLLFRPDLGPGEELAAEVHLEPDCFRLRVTAAEVEVAQGFMADAPFELHTQPKTLVCLATGLRTVREAQESGELHIARGREAAVERLFGQFALPQTD